MFCNRCGAQLPDGAAACPGCGSPITYQTRPAATVTPSQTPLDPERYQQLLAEKARRDAEKAQAEAEYAVQQARLAQEKAAQARQQYAQQTARQQAVQQAAQQQVSAQQAAPQSVPQPIPAAAVPAAVPAQTAPLAQKKKKKSPLPLILGIVALVSVAAIALILLWPTLFGTKSGSDRRDKDKLSADADGDKTTETKRPTEPTKTPAPEEDSTPSGGETVTPVEYEITVWVSDSAVDLTRSQIEAFNRTNTDGITILAHIYAYSESLAAQEMLYDVAGGPDIYCFAQDQYARLRRGGALSALPYDLASAAAEENSAGVVAACSSGGRLYAYPMTSDNGYFMYYDKSVIPEGDLDSLEALLVDCAASRRYFCFEMQTSAWYMASFFFATGCRSEWMTDDDGNFIAVEDNFNSDNGLIALKGMKKLLDSPFHRSSGNVGEFADGAAVVISGTWGYSEAMDLLGSNLGCAALPSFTVDGFTCHLVSFNGCKLLGVKPQADADREAALHKLARFLTDETRQMERFETLGWGPANLEAQRSPAVRANPALTALIEQTPYSVPQGQIEGSWWDIAKQIAVEAKNANSDAELRQVLQRYEDRLAALFGNAAAPNWSVIGAICGTAWDTDFPLRDTGSGIYSSDEMYLNAGDEFKIRQNGSWDVNYGVGGKRDGANFVVSQSGWYVVTFDEDDGSVTLERTGG